MNELIGQVISERYHVEAFLGKGGMADVFKVWDRVRSSHLAMKILNPKLAQDAEFTASFRQEAGTLENVQHPNIVRFYGMEKSGDLVFILMEFVEGETLRQKIIRTDRPFDLPKITQVMQAICSALNFSHQLGVIHCDMKPSNIMLRRDGTVLLADFGTAHLSGITRGQLGAGTPAYMAPEQIVGEQPRPATDIYSIGILLFELLTGGKRPFTGHHAQISGDLREKLRWEQCNLAPPSPRLYEPSIPPSLEAVVLRCLEKRPEKRYENIMQFQSAFEEAITKSASQIDKADTQESRRFPVWESINTIIGAQLGRRRNNIKAFWVLTSILVPVVLLLAFAMGGEPEINNSNPPTAPNPISTQTILFTPTPVWNAYTNAELGISIEYPPSWVYEEQDTSPILVMASSEEVLNSQGYISDGAGVALAHTPLDDTELPPTVDAASPENILEYFIAENFEQQDASYQMEKMSINGHPAATAVYTFIEPDQGLETVFYTVAIVTPETLTLMIGVCPGDEWFFYQPVFDRMRDSLRVQ